MGNGIGVRAGARLSSTESSGLAASGEEKSESPSHFRLAVPDQRSGDDERLTWVSVHSLLPADRIRLAGENDEHIRLLAATQVPLPPILVHRSTMRIIDGMHRLRAAMHRGDERVAVRFFHGDELQAFVHGVHANVTHGLPLSRADREAAVVRILRRHVEWSDRAVAEITGLSAPTVAAIRQRTIDDAGRLATRLGRDGRIRPLNSAQGRLKASEVISTRPDASLREIARAAGISVGTARDVRERLRRGEDPVPDRFADKTTRTPQPETRPGSRSGVPDEPGPAPRSAPVDSAILLHNLRRDPSLRLTEVGRSLLQWFGVHAIAADRQQEFVHSIPEHCRESVASLAWNCAEIWQQFARELEQRGRNSA
jgi:hypothetical protein